MQSVATAIISLCKEKKKPPQQQNNKSNHLKEKGGKEKMLQDLNCNLFSLFFVRVVGY